MSYSEAFIINGEISVLLGSFKTILFSIKSDAAGKCETVIVYVGGWV
jgi:hypothetical protein